MSSCVSVYIVAESSLRAASGCGDNALFRNIVRKGSDVLSTPLPDEGPSLDILSAIVGRPPLRRALKNILFGKNLNSPSEWFHICAYELIVRHFAYGYYDSWNQVSQAGEWIKSIDLASPSIGIELDFNQLLFGGGLIELPLDDFLDIDLGYWSNSTVKAYQAQVARYLRSDICRSDADPMRLLNYPIHDVAEWLDKASQTADGAVVAF